MYCLSLQELYFFTIVLYLIESFNTYPWQMSNFQKLGVFYNE